MDPRLRQRLDDFAAGLELRKGKVAISLLVTDHARKSGLPLDPDRLVTGAGTRVKGAGVASVQKILGRHGITTIFAREGGRTSPRSVAHMRLCVSLLNELHEEGLADLDAIEKFWIDRVRDMLAAKPLRLMLDSTVSLGKMIRDLLAQAVERQQGVVGSTVAGALLQHLVGAKLACAIHPVPLEHHSSSTADAHTARKGDFEVGDTVVHVTTSPSEAVITRCRTNLDEGLRPVLVTVSSKTQVAVGLAENASVADRIDIFDIEQFVALNLYEWRRFEVADRHQTARRLISEYNRIVDEVETDPSLKIVLG